MSDASTKGLFSRLPGDAASPGLTRLVLAWALPLAATLIQWLLWEEIKPFVWFAYFPMSIASAMIGGIAGGLGAGLVSVLMAFIVFMQPAYPDGVPMSFWVTAASFVTIAVILGRILHQLAISERTQSSQLVSSEARFGAIVEQSLVGIYMVRDGRFIYVNPKFADIMGYDSPEEFLGSAGRDVLSVIAPGDRARVAEVGEQRKTGEIDALRYTFRAQRKDDTVIVLEVHGHMIQLDGEPTVVGAAVDLTERVADEVKLREREELLARTSSLAKVGGWEFEVPSMEGAWTSEIARIHGVDPEQATGVEFGLSFYEGWSREVMEHAVNQAVEAGRPYDLEVELVAADGTRKWVRSVGRPIIENGRVIRVQGTMQDITDRHEAEQAVRDLNISLERRVRERTAEVTAANEELEAFSYAVSHDLRAPLRAMSGFAQALEEDYGDQLDEQGHMYTGHIVDAAKQMGDLIDGLLLLSRVTRGDLEREWVDVTRIANELIAQRRQVHPTRNVTAVVAPDLRVYGDPRMVEALVQNLVGNAWKYSAKNPHAHINVYATTLDGREWIAVQDDGAGFNPDYAGQLFEPFHRLHRQDDFPGIGIGLATVRRIANRHGGDVFAEAVEGEGATFRFWLPGPEESVDPPVHDVAHA